MTLREPEGDAWRLGKRGRFRSGGRPAPRILSTFMELAVNPPCKVPRGLKRAPSPQPSPRGRGSRV
jgi:hypothetical protein